jgi:hypothetical protein
MPKDRGGPDQGIFQDLWTGGCKRRTGGDDLFFACHPRKGVNKSLAPTRGPPAIQIFLASRGAPEPGGRMPWHNG